MKEYFKCWWCEDNRWWLRSELKKYKAGKNHIDLLCPICGHVIICKTNDPQRPTEDK